jgi:hypothetical protein
MAVLGEQLAKRNEKTPPLATVVAAAFVNE